MRIWFEDRQLMNIRDKKESVNMLQSVTKSDYKYATYMCMALALFNQLSGVSVITFYSTTIFESVNKKATVPIDIPQGNLVLSLSRTFGAIVSIVPFRYLTRRYIFISGHILMGIFLALAWYFVG